MLDIQLKPGHTTNQADTYNIDSATFAFGMQLWAGHPSGADVVNYPQYYFRAPSGVVAFPTQYAGLRTYYAAAVKELCLVAEADAPTGMGGVFKVHKGGVDYAVYLVETTDPLATPVYIRTSTGTKAVRIKT